MSEPQGSLKEHAEVHPGIGVRFHEIRNATGGSALRKYQMLMVGDPSLLSLIRYECLTTVLTYLPGLVGIVLRRLLYPLLFKRMGRGVIIGAGVTLRQPARMVLGNGCCLDDLANLSARGGEETEILLGREVFIGRGAVINVRTGRIELGDCSNIGAFSRIGCSNGAVRIGKDVLVGPYTYIGAGNHRFERTDIPMSQQGQDHKGGVVIGDDVWIGGGCHVLDGVTVGRGTIIGAGSIVTRNIPEYSIAFGVPAKVYRKRVGSEQPDARPDG